MKSKKTYIGLLLIAIGEMLSFIFELGMSHASRGTLTIVLSDCLAYVVLIVGAFLVAREEKYFYKVAITAAVSIVEVVAIELLIRGRFLSNTTVIYSFDSLFDLVRILLVLFGLALLLEKRGKRFKSIKVLTVIMLIVYAAGVLLDLWGVPFFAAGMEAAISVSVFIGLYALVSSVSAIMYLIMIFRTMKVVRKVTEV